MPPSVFLQNTSPFYKSLIPFYQSPPSFALCLILFDFCLILFDFYLILFIFCLSSRVRVKQILDRKLSPWYNEGSIRADRLSQVPHLGAIKPLEDETMATLRRVTEEIISNHCIDENDPSLAVQIRHLLNSGYETLKDDVERIIFNYCLDENDEDLAEELRDLCL